jgi:Trypsin-like peptidase domain
MRYLLICCTILLFLPAPSHGATFGQDDRIAVTRPDAAFLPIGVVKGGKHVAHATGFLVSDCHVLTVKHAAGRVGNVMGRRMTFRLPSAGRDGTSAGIVVAAGELDLVADPDRLDRSKDWLLLRLDRCLGGRFGSLSLGQSGSPSSRTLMSAGFPSDRSWRRQLTIDPQCRLRGTPLGLFVHDCSSLPGNSGSPIFTTTWRDGQPSLVVIAMHSTAAVTKRVLTYRPEDGSVATRISDVLPAIRAHLAPPVFAAKPGSSGTSNGS